MLLLVRGSRMVRMIGRRGSTGQVHCMARQNRDDGSTAPHFGREQAATDDEQRAKADG